MAPPYRGSFPSDHDDLLHYSSSDHLFFPTTPQASASSSSLSFPSLFPSLDHSNSDDPRSVELKHEDGGIIACNNDQTLGNDEDVETGLRFTIWKQIEKSESSSCCENNHNNNDLVKWSSSSSSKIRLVINSNQRETATQTINGCRNFQDHNWTSPSPSDQTNKRSTLNDGGGLIIRTCSDCNTTKTPLWRSGPRGPKSLCNACGIRQRKARRAMAEAAAEANGAIPCGGKPAAVVLKTKKAVQHKMKPATTLKRKCKDVVISAAAAGGGGGRGRKKLCFEDMKIGSRLSEISSAYQRVFPQDEREAAILLMTLSYGLLHG